MEKAHDKHGKELPARRMLSGIPAGTANDTTRYNYCDLHVNEAQGSELQQPEDPLAKLKSQ